MSAPLALNLRVVSVDGDDAFIALSHFGTDSGILFHCTFNDKEEFAKWGVAPHEIRGDELSYFGQFVGELAAQRKPVRGKEGISEYNLARLNALSDSVSFLLNEINNKLTSKENAFILPKDLSAMLNEQIYTLRLDHQETAQMIVTLIPLNMTQADFAGGMAKLSEVFDSNMPKFMIDGDGATGTYPSLKAELKKRATVPKTH